jgi:hypothetical protein
MKSSSNITAFQRIAVNVSFFLPFSISISATCGYSVYNVVPDSRGNRNGKGEKEGHVSRNLLHNCITRGLPVPSQKNPPKKPTKTEIDAKMKSELVVPVASGSAESSWRRNAAICLAIVAAVALVSNAFVVSAV